MKQNEKLSMARGLISGTALGLLMAAAFVGATGDASWVIFSITLGWALGLGIAVWQQRVRLARHINEE